MFDNHNINTDTGFELFENKYVAEQEITTGSNYMFGNGYMGYRGTNVNATKDNYAACIVSDTYDNSDGKWRELCNVPNGLFTALTANGNKVDAVSGETTSYRRELDLSAAILSTKTSNPDVRVEVERFAAMDRLHVLAMKYTVTAKNNASIEIETGIDGDVWSINGEHFGEYNLDQEGDNLLIHSVTNEFKTQVYVTENCKISNCCAAELKAADKKNMRNFAFDLKKDEVVTIEKFVSIYSSNDVADPKAEALKTLEEVKALGYDKVKEDHKAKWAEVWGKHDIQIKGNLRDQTLTRFNLYHNIIHTPTHALLPVGARGLSCQAYQGAAFWDEEIFNLPMYLYTNPAVAKNILMYRHATLDGARKKAKKLGYRGAFYAWISGKTGEELCPDFFFKDVLTGRKIRNHFNIWQIHVSPDIAYTIWRYYEVTGDKDFLFDYGAEMMLDISLFLLSRSFYNVDKDRYEYIRLLGPDEYHENVDNNVFTNYQAKYTLQKTMEVCALMEKERPDFLKELCTKLEITADNMATFAEMVEKMYIKEPNESKVYEQFDNYFDLEDTTPEVLKTRLQDKSEYWGWPNGVAVHTQVLKQADLIQLMVMHDDFDQETLKANFDYYEPRTEHGSSLSPAMYSIIASKIGYAEYAYNYFIKSCTVDLYNANKAISGGTFIGGIHTASCGAVWQMIIFGFAGFSEYDNVLHFKPKLPAEWEGFDFNVHHKNNFIDVTVTKGEIDITSRSDNEETLSIDVFGKTFTVKPGETVKTQY